MGRSVEALLSTHAFVIWTRVKIYIMVKVVQGHILLTQMSECGMCGRVTVTGAHVMMPATV